MTKACKLAPLFAAAALVMMCVIVAIPWSSASATTPVVMAEDKDGGLYAANLVDVTFADGVTLEQAEALLEGLGCPLDNVVGWPGTDYEAPFRCVVAKVGEGMTPDEAIALVSESPLVKEACRVGIAVADNDDALEYTAPVEPKHYIDSVEGVKDKLYTGGPVTQSAFTVKHEGTVLKEGIDYVVSYERNVDIGEAFAVISSKDDSWSPISVGFGIVGRWTRLFGDNAQGTMSEAGRAGFSGVQPKIIVATQDSYYDALAASGLAGLIDCPIMTVAGGKLSSENVALLAEWSPSKVYIVGGTASVPESIAAAIEREIPNVSIERVAGSNAIATAEAIYDEGKAAAGWGDTAIVTTLDAYQDALSASPFAFAKKAPIFLVAGTGGTLPESSLSKIKAGGFKRVLIVGGTTSVGAVEDQLAGIECVRKSGDNCYATSNELANWCWSEGMTGSEPAVATGTSYYDALVGGPVCGKSNSVLVVADPGHLDAVNGFIAAHKDVFPESGYLLGGEASVPNEVDMAVNLALI